MTQFTKCDILLLLWRIYSGTEHREERLQCPTFTLGVTKHDQRRANIA